jgi:hypothetical protein
LFFRIKEAQAKDPPSTATVHADPAGKGQNAPPSGSIYPRSAFNGTFVCQEKRRLWLLRARQALKIDMLEARP